jgi:hypothetical protein
VQKRKAGRPKSASPKHRVICVRFRDKEVDTLSAYARDRNLTLSDVIRQCVAQSQNLQHFRTRQEEEKTAMAMQVIPPKPGERLPRHTNVLYPPSGPPVVVASHVPVGKLAGRWDCKYCYRTHHNWWLMDQDDYRIDGLIIILCGECEHTSGISPEDEGE